MKNYNSLAFGWKFNQHKIEAVTKKRSRADLILSLVTAFLIIFLIAQIVGYLDKVITNPVLQRGLSYLSPWQAQTALAAENETLKMIQSHREINIVKGVGFTFEVGFKNKTNYTWTKAGSNSVDLKIAPPYNRETVVRHKFWRDTETPAWLKDEQAKSGWIAYYKFALEAPKEPGVYKEKFVLVNYGDKHILSGSEFEITLNVYNSSSEFSKTSLTAKQTTATTNTATATTAKVDGQGYVLTDEMKMGRTCLDLSVQKFRISSTVTMKTVEDCKKIGIDLTPNIYTDPAVSTPLPTPTPTPSPTSTSTDTTPTVTPVASASNGPILRVGLFYSTDPVIITANSAYQIADKNGAVLASVSTGNQAQITFNFSTKAYTLVANNQTTSTVSYLRFIGNQDNTVFEIVSYEQRPAWNLSLNDNKYLGVLEVRYASATDRLWVINELPMENYLMGLAETSNDSPLEYQKALVTAARTYAMYHYNRGTKHASENFIVDAKYDQVYKGYGSQIRLTNVVTAVNQTRGIMVTYNNEVVVTPYFSYSDGHTRSWAEVWGGNNVPWCQSVVEPADYDKTTLYGHGVGLSAHGALHLAANYNYNYEQILKYYYTGIALKSIY